MGARTPPPPPPELLANTGGPPPPPAELMKDTHIHTDYPVADAVWNKGSDYVAPVLKYLSGIANTGVADAVKFHNQDWDGEGLPPETLKDAWKGKAHPLAEMLKDAGVPEGPHLKDIIKPGTYLKGMLTVDPKINPSLLDLGAGVTSAAINPTNQVASLLGEKAVGPAYEAMGNDRTRSAMRKVDQSLRQLKRYAGTDATPMGDMAVAGDMTGNMADAEKTLYGLIREGRSRYKDIYGAIDDNTDPLKVTDTLGPVLPTLRKMLKNEDNQPAAQAFLQRLADMQEKEATGAPKSNADWRDLMASSTKKAAGSGAGQANAYGEISNPPAFKEIQKLHGAGIKQAFRDAGDAVERDGGGTLGDSLRETDGVYGVLKNARKSVRAQTSAEAGKDGWTQVDTMLSAPPATAGLVLGGLGHPEAAATSLAASIGGLGLKKFTKYMNSTEGRLATGSVMRNAGKFMQSPDDLWTQMMLKAMTSQQENK